MSHRPPPLSAQSRTSASSRRRVIDLLLCRGALSRAELARLTHLNKPTISAIVAGLIADGLVEEIGAGTSTGGRRPILLTVPGSSRVVAGIELDASVCRLLLVGLHGERLASLELPLASTQAAEVVETMAVGLDDLVAGRDRSTLLGCGVAVPGLVDLARDTVDSAVRLGWEGVPLRPLLEARLGVPVMITDRGKAAGLGELWVLRKERVHDLIYLYLGRGVAGAIVLGREIHWGASYLAGEIGHMAVDPNGPTCSCGNRGCLEALVSTSAIIHRSRRLLGSGNDGRLARALRTDLQEGAAIAAIGAAATAGDEVALAIVAETAGWLGIAIAGLVNALNPAVVVLGGPTAAWGTVLVDAVGRAVAARALPLARRAVTIVAGQAGDLAVPLGAAALVLQQAADLLAGSRSAAASGRSAA
jgi:predicted NBD/HSP70 family sugar kinase